jgi:methyl-accepting chemotaxis protein
VEEIAAVMKQIDDQTQANAEKVRQLTERTAEITAMNESIASIAKNVTIVAINASIEAARAGAAGRTFQVVAEQVQDLAKQTAQAAQAIGELAERVRSDLSSINRDLDESSSVVGRGVEISQTAKAALQLIHQAVAEIHTLLAGIDRDAQLQQASAGKIAEGIALLREKTERNVAHIETAAASTEETAAIMEEHVRIVQRLRERSETLQRLIARYSASAR